MRFQIRRTRHSPNKVSYDVYSKAGLFRKWIWEIAFATEGEASAYIKDNAKYPHHERTWDYDAQGRDVTDYCSW